MAGIVDNSGQPLAGGKVYTYEPGTTTNKAAYTQQNKGATAANPIILDAYGRAEVYGTGGMILRSIPRQTLRSTHLTMSSTATTTMRPSGAELQLEVPTPMR